MSEFNQVKDISKPTQINDTPNIAKAEKIAELMQIIAVKGELYSGPVPHPDILEKCEKICPGAAGVFFKAYENQVNHRIESENKELDTRLKVMDRGQIFAFVMGMSSIIGGVILTLCDKDTTGLTLLLGAIGTLAVTFMFGKIINNKEIEDKNKEINKMK